MPEQLNITPLEAHTCMQVKSWQPALAPPCMGSTGLPTKVGTVVPGLARILCLAPGEWLLTSTARSIRNLVEHIAGEGDLLDGLVLVDLSDAHSELQIEGQAARELLSKGCGLDFHASVFRVGQCARTR